MKKRTIVSAVISLIVMVAAPLVAIFSTEALGLMFILTFLINPVASVVIGVLSADGEKIYWYIPIVNAVVYLAAAIVITGFDVSLIAFAIVYFALSALVAYIKYAIKKRKAQQ